MYYKIGDDTVVVAGCVGTMKEKTSSLLSVSIADKVSKTNTEWRWVSFANPEDSLLPQWKSLGEKLVVGQYITVVCSVKQSGIYTNLYVKAFEYGPKPKK